MKKILITGANSYIGTSFEKYIKEKFSNQYIVDTLDMIDESWRSMSFEGYDVIYHVAGIAHSDTGKISDEKKKLYYSVNTDLTFETARKAKDDGVKQFIYMSSMIVYGDSAPIGKTKIISKNTSPNPANSYDELFDYLSFIEKSYGTNIVIFYHPTEALNADGTIGFSKNSVLDIFATKAQNYGITFVDMTDAFTEMYYNEHHVAHGFITGKLGSGHLNAYGHAAIAEQLYKTITELEEDGELCQ